MSNADAVALGRIARRRAVDEVHEAIRDAILDRRFPPGMRLNLEELASQLGVSFTPVRSALQLLAAEGLVDVHSRSGTFVASLSRRDLEETFDIRYALECLAAEKASKLLTEEQIEQATKLVAIMARPVRSESQRKAHEQANHDFHDILIAASGNQRLSDIYNSLRAHLTMGRIHRLKEDWQSRLAVEQKEHEQILEAMKKRDTQGLVSALRKHILRAKEALLNSMDES